MASKKKATKKGEEEKNDEDIKEKTKTAVPTKKKEGETTQEKEKHYALWGLGRGIDVTKPTPWLEKTSFQVRQVKLEDIIETDDGGLLKEFTDEIRCRTDLNCEVKSGVKAPNTPLTIGVAAEYTRSSLTTKYVVGTRVKNRTISFRADFMDLPQSRAEDVNAAIREILTSKALDKEDIPGAAMKRQATETSVQDSQSQAVNGVEASVISQSTETTGQDTQSQTMATGVETAKEGTDAGPPKTTETFIERAVSETSSETRRKPNEFEKRLCEWLIECLVHRGELEDGENIHGLYKFIRRECEKPKVEDSKLKLIDGDIQHFVEHFGVTHYVSAIELGGLEYEEQSGKEYQQTAAVSGSASVTTPQGGAEASVKTSHSKFLKSVKKERKKIGRIDSTDEKVTDENEAVIGCQIQPISNLVKNPYLQRVLTSCTANYTRKQYKDDGPYFITCGDVPTMYITVDKDRNLEITFKEEEAEAFSLKVLGDHTSHHKFEFSLASALNKYRDTVKKNKLSQTSKDDTGKQLSPEDSTQGEAKASKSPEQPQASKDDTGKQLPLDYYLETVVHPLRGKDSIQPRMRMNSNTKNIRMLLKRRINHRIACDTKQWRKGREAYYIQCIHPFRSGYLCVKKKKSSGSTNSYDPKDYKVCVKPSVDSHCDDSSVFMLFRLKPERVTDPKPTTLKQ